MHMILAQRAHRPYQLLFFVSNHAPIHILAEQIFRIDETVLAAHASEIDSA